MLLTLHDLRWSCWLHMTWSVTSLDLSDCTWPDQWPPLTLLTDRPDLSWPYCMTWPLLTLLIAHDLISNLPWPCWLHMTWPVTSLDIADRPDLSWPYCMTWPQLTLLHDMTSVNLADCRSCGTGKPATEERCPEEFGYSTGSQIWSVNYFF